MDKGRIVQKAPAKELYLHPNSLFLANFMGESSIFAGELHGNSVSTNGYRFELPDAAQYGLADGACLVGVRPEAITLQRAAKKRSAATSTTPCTWATTGKSSPTGRGMNC